MPKPRIDSERAKEISKKAQKLAKLKGGTAKMMRGTGLYDSVIYRAMGGAMIEIEKAEKLEAFFLQEGI